jgi:AcrR family transcriptional regulator
MDASSEEPPDLRSLVHPPGRADARRNYAALLAAAAEIFGRDGPDASLDEIARRAGVANATLYRHFPTRRELLVAVCVEEVENLRRLGEQLRDPDRPGRALASWLGAYVEHVSSRRGLGAAMMTGNAEDSGIAAACGRVVGQTCADLLEPAQRAGEARADLLPADLLEVVSAVATAAESDDRPGRAERLLDLVLHGILQHRGG